MSLRRATSDTDAPGSKVCSASCRLNSRGKFGRLPGAGLLLSTISATLVPTKIFGGNQITFLHRNTESGRHEALTKYPNNLIARDHRNIKSETNAMLGFKRVRNAATMVSGIELTHRIRKGQFDLSALAVKDTAAYAI